MGRSPDRHMKLTEGLKTAAIGRPSFAEVCGSGDPPTTAVVEVRTVRASRTFPFFSATLREPDDSVRGAYPTSGSISSSPSPVPSSLELWSMVSSKAEVEPLFFAFAATGLAVVCRNADMEFDYNVARRREKSPKFSRRGAKAQSEVRHFAPWCEEHATGRASREPRTAFPTPLARRRRTETIRTLSRTFPRGEIVVAEGLQFDAGCSKISLGARWHIAACPS